MVRKSNFDLTTIAVIIIDESAKGIKIDPIKRGEKIWLPKSQIEIYREEQKIKLPYWLALENDLV